MMANGFGFEDDKGTHHSDGAIKATQPMLMASSSCSGKPCWSNSAFMPAKAWFKKPGSSAGSMSTAPRPGNSTPQQQEPKILMLSSTWFKKKPQ